MGKLYQIEVGALLIQFWKGSMYGSMFTYMYRKHQLDVERHTIHGFFENDIQWCLQSSFHIFVRWTLIGDQKDRSLNKFGLEIYPGLALQMEREECERWGCRWFLHGGRRGIVWQYIPVGEASQWHAHMMPHLRILMHTSNSSQCNAVVVSTASRLLVFIPFSVGSRDDSIKRQRFWSTYRSTSTATTTR